MSKKIKYRLNVSSTSSYMIGANWFVQNCCLFSGNVSSRRHNFSNSYSWIIISLNWKSNLLLKKSWNVFAYFACATRYVEPFCASAEHLRKGIVQRLNTDINHCEWLEVVFSQIDSQSIMPFWRKHTTKKEYQLKKLDKHYHCFKGKINFEGNGFDLLPQMALIIKDKTTILKPITFNEISWD